MVRMDQNLDAERIRAYRNGDDSAFAALYRHYERPLYAFILRFNSTRSQADDLFQQTWLKIIKGLPNYDEQGKFSSWLFGIANNCCIDAVRKQKRTLTTHPGDRQQDVFESMPTESPDPEATTIQNEEKSMMEAALDLIPEEQRQVLLLRIHGEMPFKEIASLLNCPINTVLGRMHYAVRNLRKILEKNSKEGYSHVVS